MKESLVCSMVALGEFVDVFLYTVDHGARVGVGTLTLANNLGPVVHEQGAPDSADAAELSQ